MGKSDGFLTPKAIANRIKAKGLQKLRWYCQMCQKQCRDENGFKCHTSSESHQRQMAIFSDNPNKFLDSFSAEFEESFIRHLRHRHGTKRVHANMVYAELIRDRHHLHMNATKWTSLTEFVKYLGRTGKATVDETPKGWFLAYIDRDPETIARQKALERRKKADVDEEERERLRIEKQLEEARRQREALGGGEEEDVATADDSNGDDAESRQPQQQQAGELVKLEGVKIAFSLGASKIGKPPAPLLASVKADAEKDPHEVDVDGDDGEEKTQARQKRKAEDHDRRHRHDNDDDDGNDVDDKRRSSRREEDQDGADHRREFKRPRGSRWDATATTTTTSTTTTASSGAERDERESSSARRAGSAPAPARPLTAVEEIMLQEERRKQRLERERLERERREKEEQEKMLKEKEKMKAKAKRTDYWLAEGIVVKVKHKTVGGGKYYNQKGVIEQVDGRYVGQVRMLQGGDVLRLDQEFLETVLPALEGKVLVVNGEHRGERATLKTIDVDKFCATIELRGSGELVKGVAYEDIAKLA